MQNVQNLVLSFWQNWHAPLNVVFQNYSHILSWSTLSSAFSSPPICLSHHLPAVGSSVTDVLSGIFWYNLVD